MTKNLQVREGCDPASSWTPQRSYTLATQQPHRQCARQAARISAACANLIPSAQVSETWVNRVPVWSNLLVTISQHFESSWKEDAIFNGSCAQNSLVSRRILNMHNEALWDILRCHGIPALVMCLMATLYSGTESVMKIWGSFSRSVLHPQQRKDFLSTIILTVLFYLLKAFRCICWRSLMSFTVMIILRNRKVPVLALERLPIIVETSITKGSFDRDDGWVVWRLAEWHKSVSSCTSYWIQCHQKFPTHWYCIA